MDKGWEENRDPKRISRMIDENTWRRVQRATKTKYLSTQYIFLVVYLIAKSTQTHTHTKVLHWNKTRSMSRHHHDQRFRRWPKRWMHHFGSVGFTSSLALMGRPKHSSSPLIMRGNAKANKETSQPEDWDEINKRGGKRWCAFHLTMMIDDSKERRSRPSCYRAIW